MKHLKTPLILLLLAAPFFATAQFKFGAKGGLNIARFSRAIVTSVESTSSIENVLGFNVGLMFEVKLPVKIGVELDVLYSSKGVSLTIDGNAGRYLHDYSLNYIDLPVVVKWYMFKVTNLQAGLQYSHLLTADYHVKGFDKEDVKAQFSTGDVIAVVGFGVDVSKIHFSARYNLGLIDITNGTGNTKSNMFTFSLGFWLKN
jgi:hypothetical protein